jgi:hypothetical protein
MVQVHTAAIIPPEGISVDHPIAFVSAAIGGMAAPMFVTISGWGIYRSATRRSNSGNNNISSWISWMIPRITILTICQLLVNSALFIDRGGRFDWMTGISISYWPCNSISNKETTIFYDAIVYDFTTDNW